MPVTATGQGYGDWTEEKQADFTEILNLHLMISKNIIYNINNVFFAKQMYYYFDLNAGIGKYYENGRQWLGSSVIFMEAIHRYNIPYYARFIELNKKACQQLEKDLKVYQDYPLKDDSFYKICNGDNKNILLGLSKEIERITKRDVIYGLIYQDDNGAEMPFEEIGIASNVSPRCKLDVLMYVQPGSYKRKKNSFRERNLEEFINLTTKLKKKHIQIRKPSGAHQYTFLFATNWTDKHGKMGYPIMKRNGFYDANSTEGIEILEKLNYTKGELELLKLQRQKANE